MKRREIGHQVIEKKMLRINYPKIKCKNDLKRALQNAIKLELCTIPPYLTSWWTISGKSPGAIATRTVLKDIWKDEMYHMLAACNLLNSIGGAPVLNHPDVAPQFPGPLPMTIGSNSEAKFEVPLQRYSRALVRDTYMVIESPEIPIPIGKETKFMTTGIDDHYGTIGEFYGAIEATIREGGEGLFSASNSLQVDYGQVKPVVDVKSAIEAIEIIRHQGEGSSETPISHGKTFAHFYRFESLSRGLALKIGADDEPFFDPTEPIVLDELSEVVAMADNPGQLDFHGNPIGLKKAKEFDLEYTSLLAQLHEVVNGRPEQLGLTIDILMPTLSDLAGDLLNHQIEEGSLAGQFAGPRFLYV